MTHKKSLVELTTIVVRFLAAFDKIMKMPESVERGKALAKICNVLDMKNDSAMHFGLEYGFKKINNLKKKIDPFTNEAANDKNQKLSNPNQAQKSVY